MTQKTLEQSIKTFQGPESVTRLLDDVFETLKYSGGEVLISGIDERKFLEAGYKYLNLGGSETAGLFQFKEKFSPIAYNKMHWAVYRV